MPNKMIFLDPEFVEQCYVLFSLEQQESLKAAIPFDETAIALLDAIEIPYTVEDVNQQRTSVHDLVMQSINTTGIG